MAGQSSQRKSLSPAVSRGGCLPLAFACLIACLLLAINAAVVGSLLGVLMNWLPSWLRRPKVEQGLFFVLPIVLTGIEWWLADLVNFRGGDPSPDQAPASSENRPS